MISAQSAIHRYRRDIVLGRVLRAMLFVAGMACVLVLPLFVRGFDATIGLALVFGLWLMLSLTSVKNARLLAASPELIARGEFEEAEQRIDEALRAFSLSRSSKLLGLHHLAVLRHKQRRWQDAASLCRAVLAQRGANVPADLGASVRLMLADASLELGDAQAAGDAIGPLRGQPLGLTESFVLLQVELDVLARLGMWDAALAGLAGKVQLAEIMPPTASARVQATLALAAAKRGMNDWSDWLRRRVELLADVGKLTSDRPLLWELWRKDAAAETP